MTILLVDHKCHLRTKSFDFVRRLLSRRFTVLTHHYDVVYKPGIPKDMLSQADVVVFLEFLASRFALGVTGKCCVYFPMYDNEWGSIGLWKRLALLGMNVVSFCRRVSDHARRCGVRDIIDVQYAFDPDKFQGMAGNPRVVALWERGSVTFECIKRIFSPEDIDKVILIRRPSEGIAYSAISSSDMERYHVELHESEFLPDDEYLAILRAPGVYIAPRLKEGIGMAFLEQMAMGKCVIAHRDATMDEYIEDGETGILVDMRAPRRVSADEITHVRANMAEKAKSLYARWLEDEDKILDSFQNLDASTVLRSPWNVRSLLWYAFYWIEGFGMKLASR